MPGSEFEPRSPLQKETPPNRVVFLFGLKWCRKPLIGFPHTLFLPLRSTSAVFRRCWTVKTGHPIWVSCFLLNEENSLLPPVREAHIQSEVRQGSCESPQAIRGMPGSEFEPRSPLQNVLMKDATQKTPHESAAFSHIMRHFLNEKVAKTRFFKISVLPSERRHF